MKAELVPINGDPPIPITRDVTVVGRREFCDVQVNDPSLSKRHCVLIKTDGLLVIRDLGTTNGTKVKGQRVRWAALLPDDRITLGSYKMRVYLGPDDAPGPSELARFRTSNQAQPQPKPPPLPLKGSNDRATARAAPEVDATAVQAQMANEPAKLSSTPVVPPTMAEVIGEDDENWQNLEILDDEKEDVIIELD
jgi:pSer/pThr/pTyr-binding forkhead associated (FHA) protein